MMSVLGRVLFEEPRRPSELRPDVPQPLDDLVLRALSKSPGRRPADRIRDDVPARGARLPRRAVHRAAPVLRPDDRRAGPRERRRGGRAGGPRGRSDRVGRRVVVPGRSRRLAASGDAARFGGRPERLANGALLVVFTGMPCATDQVAQAARCALAMQSAEAMALSMRRGGARAARGCPWATRSTARPSFWRARGNRRGHVRRCRSTVPRPTCWRSASRSSAKATLGSSGASSRARRRRGRCSACRPPSWAARPKWPGSRGRAGASALGARAARRS